MRIEFHETIDSTQRRARELVERGDRRWDAVCAAHQTAGRGRQGAHWHDAPGQSLLVSIILWDAPLPEPVGLVGLLAALATAQALEQTYPDLPPVQLKYPNDLIVHNRKLGGILAEIVEGVPIVGIGVNLSQTAFPPELEGVAISIAQAVKGSPRPPAPPDKGTTPHFNSKSSAPNLPNLTPPPPLSVNREGGADAMHAHGSPSPFTERGLGGEVEAAQGTSALTPQSPLSHAVGEGGVGSPLPQRGRGVGGEGILPIECIHANLIELWRLPQEQIFSLWQARDCSAGRAYVVQDLPGQPVGVAIGIDEAFRLRLRLPSGMEHSTYYVSAV
jgi:biotin-(acetyl-CoA carboxylase) ligase